MTERGLSELRYFAVNVAAILRAGPGSEFAFSPALFPSSRRRVETVGAPAPGVLRASPLDF